MARAVSAWVDAHLVPFFLAVAATTISVVVGSKEATHWVYAGLAYVAAVCCLVVIVEGAARRAAAMIAGAIATISGALLTLDLGFAMDHPSRGADPNVSALLVTIVVAGAASLYGQFREHRSAEEAERRLHRRLDEIESGLGGDLARLRLAVEQARVEATSKQDRSWWRRR